jgi:hypothetical protein
MRAITTLVAGASLGLGLATAVAASPIPNVSGVWGEGGPNNNWANVASSNFISDTSNATTDPILEVVGPLTFHGTVTHQNTPNVRYKDGFTLDFGALTYAVTLSWDVTSQDGFDGEFTAGSDTRVVSGDTGTVDFGNLTGSVAFLIDPVAGQLGPTETINWTLQATPVPLPAGVVLLLTGLGGLAIAKRRNKA